MASTDPTLVLRLPRAALARRDAVDRLAATWQARKLFAFKCDELDFARALLARRTNLWLYRTSQRAFAGDFIVVDLSSPSAEARTVHLIELKRGEPLRVGLPSSATRRPRCASSPGAGSSRTCPSRVRSPVTRRPCSPSSIGALDRKRSACGREAALLIGQVHEIV